MSNLQAYNSPLADTSEFRKFQHLLQKHRIGHALPATDRGWAPLLTFQSFPRDLMETGCNMQLPWNPQGSDEALTDLIDIDNRLHQDGFLHWNDSLAASSLKSFQDLGNFPAGLRILRFILARAQLRAFLRKWFAPNEGPYIKGHCFYYSDVGTRGLPLFLRHNPNQSDRCLGLHILTDETRLRYFAGSHVEFWAPTGLHWFQNSQASLQNQKSELRSKGL